MNKRDKVFWHEAFFEALQLEFHQYTDSLEFVSEHPLSKEALIMDVLVVKKKPGVVIEKNIGRIFREHNIFEYKSETDTLTERDYNKVIAYALLYSSFAPVPLSDVTVSYVVTMHPGKLLKYLHAERGLTVEMVGDGIYYIAGDVVPVQILESKLLSANENLFLRSLRSNLTHEDVTIMAEAYKVLKIYEQRNVYLDRLVKANADAFMEAMSMNDSDAMRKILELADKRGWLRVSLKERDAERDIEIAKRFLFLGRPIEEVAGALDLPVEALSGLV